MYVMHVYSTRRSAYVPIIFESTIFAARQAQAGHVRMNALGMKAQAVGGSSTTLMSWG